MIRHIIARRQLVLLGSALIVLLCLYVYYEHGFEPRYRPKQRPVTKNPPLQVPTDYDASAPEPLWCQDRFGLRYLENARNLTGSYCDPGATSSLNCFWSETAKSRLDTTCYGTSAVFDAERKTFHLDCPLRARTPEDDAQSIPRVPDDFHNYWYETGPRQVMSKSLLLDGSGTRPDPQRTTILVKREGTHNLWHSLMEIISLSWSLDLLQMSATEAGAAYLTANQMNSSQIVLVDDFDNGPYIDLWRLFAQMPLRRLSELGADEPPSNIIIPFVGASNPIWQGDWEETPCTKAPLLRTFISRVLDFYKISDPISHDTDTSNSNTDIVVTFVERKGARELVDQEAHMEALREAVPHMKLDVVDFAAMPLREQIEVAQRTDVLLGVHGAGLTHAMFMKPGSVLVEVLPAEFKHKGFRNLAQMLGHRYFRTHAQPRAAAAREKRGDWQQDTVEIDRSRLIDVVRAGVRAMYSRGGRSYDIS